MATILESIGDYLQNTASAFGAHASQGTLGTNLFLGVLPETPDACVAVYENGKLWRCIQSKDLKDCRAGCEERYE